MVWAERITSWLTVQNENRNSATAPILLSVDVRRACYHRRRTFGFRHTLVMKGEKFHELPSLAIFVSTIRQSPVGVQALACPGTHAKARTPTTIYGETI